MILTPNVSYDHSERHSIFFMSDLHIEDNDFDEKRFLQDIDRAVKTGQRIFLGGDMFSLILAKDMKRFTGSRAKVKKQKAIDAYINEGIRYATEVLTPYADHIDFIGTGNHESTTVKFNGIDPSQYVIAALNLARSDKLQPIRRLGYKGFIDLRFCRKNDRGRFKTMRIWYDHGRGGGAAVTKGMIDMNRTLAAVEGVDVIWLQHKHVRWADMGIGRYSSNCDGVPYVRDIVGMITGTYQTNLAHDNIEDENYIIHFGEERAFAPQGMGGITINFYPERNDKDSLVVKMGVEMRN